MGRDYGGKTSEDTPLLEDGSSLYAYKREYRNIGWFWTWLTVFLLSCAGGVYALLHRNTNFSSLISHDSLANPDTCPLPKANERSLLEELDADRGDPIQLDDFLKQAVFWIIGAVTLAFVVGASFLLLVRHHARALVFIAITLQIVLPAGLAGIGFASGKPSVGIALVLLTALMIFVFWLWKSQINLVTRLLGVAGHGLVENSGLIGAAIFLQGLLIVLLVPLALSTVAAIMNGKVVYNSDRDPSVPADQCVDMNGEETLCCSWEVDTWVRFFLSFAAITLVWTTFLAFEIRTFTVSGAVAAWYFEPVTTNGRRPSRTLRSLGHALGPAIGSLCLGSAILTLVYAARQALDALREMARNNILVWCLVAMLNLFYSLIEFATKFATVRMAITGEEFFEAGHKVVDLLMRNFLDAYGVWWLPPMILQSCAFVVSASTALVMYGASYSVWSHTPAITQAPQYAALLAVISFAACWAVLSFFCSLLLNIVDAVFVCYAMDLDNQSCTMVDVHEVYSLLPVKKPGPVVENPGGEVAYGAPTAEDGPVR